MSGERDNVEETIIAVDGAAMLIWPELIDTSPYPWYMTDEEIRVYEEGFRHDLMRCTF